MSGYGELLRSAGVAKILLAQLAARLPLGMLSIILLIHLENIYNSFASAGLVLAALSVAQAVFAPLVGRMVSLLGVLQVLLTTTLICVSSLLIIAFIPLPIWLATALGLLVGITNPPVQSIVRAIYPKLVNQSLTTRLFSVDASLQEIIWMIGPMLITFVAIAFTPGVGVAVTAAIMLFGVIWLAACREIRTLRIPPNQYSFGRILKKPTVTLPTIIGLLVVGACAAIEVAVVAAFKTGDGDHHSISFLAGIILTVWSVGSMIGGFAFGHRPITPWSMALRSIPVIVGLVMAIFSLNFWWLILSLFVSGIGLAPLFAAMYSVVSASVKFSSTPEAFGWLSSGQLVGGALTSAIAGILIDNYGPQTVFALGALITVMVGVLAIIFKPWMPNLSKLDSPLYTSPITLPLSLRETSRKKS